MSAQAKQSHILTSEVARARAAFIRAVEASIASCALDRETAAGKLSQIMGDMWNHLELQAMTNLPPASDSRWHTNQQD